MNRIPKWVLVFITYVKHNTSNNVFIFSSSCPTAPKSPVKTENLAKFQKKKRKSNKMLTSFPQTHAASCY